MRELAVVPCMSESWETCAYCPLFLDSGCHLLGDNVQLMFKLIFALLRKEVTSKEFCFIDLDQEVSLHHKKGD